MPEERRDELPSLAWLLQAITIYRGESICHFTRWLREGSSAREGEKGDRNSTLLRCSACNQTRRRGLLSKQLHMYLAHKVMVVSFIENAVILVNLRSDTLLAPALATVMVADACTTAVFAPIFAAVVGADF